MLSRTSLLVDLIIVFVMLTTVFASNVDAVPFSSETVAAGTIDDMWLEDGACYLYIHIEWSESTVIIDTDIVAQAMFLDETNGTYDSLPSSQGWRTGDSFNATLIHYGDERADYYALLLSPKSDENFAEPLSFLERNPLVPYFIVMVIVIVIGAIITRAVFGVKYGEGGKKEASYYMRFLKRM